MQTLLESQASFYTEILDQISDAVIATDLEFKILYWNKACEQLYGIEAKDALGKSMGEMISFQYLNTSREAAAAELFEKGKWMGEVGFIQPNGTQVFLLTTVSAHLHADGRKAGFLAISKNITDHRLSNLKLNRSLMHHQQMLDGVSEGLVLLAGDGSLVTCNKNAERLLKKSREELAELCLPPFNWSFLMRNGEPLPVEELPMYKTVVDRKASGKHILGLPIDGTIRWFAVHSVPIEDKDGDNPVAAVISFNDVTEQVQLEEALQQSDAQFRSFMDNTPTLNWITSADGRILLLNKKYMKEFHFRPELIGKSMYEIFPKEAADDFLKNNNEVLRHHRTVIVTEKTLHPDGKSHHYLVMKFPVRLKDGQLAVGGTGIDITQQLEQEKELQKVATKFSAIFNSMYQFVGLMDPSGILLEANQTALAFGGFPIEEVAGKPFWEAPWWSHNPEVQRKLREAIQAAAEGEFVRYEEWVKGADGKLITIDFSIKPIFNEQGEVILLIPEGRDISELKQLQETLRMQDSLNRKQQIRAAFEAQEKERSIIGKALHDTIGQNLISAKMFLEMDKIDHPTQQKAVELLRDSIREIREVSKALTPAVLADLGFKENVVDLVESMTSANGPQIQLHLNEEVIPLLSADLLITFTRIIQESLSNVLRHAQAKSCRIELFQEMEKVVLQVVDDGIGFDMAKDPYGSLNVVRYRVDSFNGTLQLHSSPGKGTTMRVEFPL